MGEPIRWFNTSSKLVLVLLSLVLLVITGGLVLLRAGRRRLDERGLPTRVVETLLLYAPRAKRIWSNSRYAD